MTFNFPSLITAKKISVNQQVAPIERLFKDTDVNYQGVLSCITSYEFLCDKMINAKATNPNGKNTDVLNKTKNALIQSYVAHYNQPKLFHAEANKTINQNLKSRLSRRQIAQLASFVIGIPLLVSIVTGFFGYFFWSKSSTVKAKEKLKDRLKELKTLPDHESTKSPDPTRGA